MKRIDLIVSHEHLPELNAIAYKHKVGGITFYSTKGRGHSKLEPVDAGRGVIRYTPEFQVRMKCEILVQDATVKTVVDEILDVLSAGSSPDGMILVYNIEDTYDIRAKRER